MEHLTNIPIYEIVFSRFANINTESIIVLICALLAKLVKNYQTFNIPELTNSTTANDRMINICAYRQRDHFTLRFSTLRIYVCTTSTEWIFSASEMPDYM